MGFVERRFDDEAARRGFSGSKPEDRITPQPRMLPRESRSMRVGIIVYRLAFGQPRQDNLLGYLGGMLERVMTMAGLEALQIRLQH